MLLARALRQETGGAEADSHWEEAGRGAVADSHWEDAAGKGAHKNHNREKLTGKSAQKTRFCARNGRKWGFRRVKAHKNLDFVVLRQI